MPFSLGPSWWLGSRCHLKTMSGLLLALLAAHGQQVAYVPGRTADQMATAYRGEAKTDARDAYVTLPRPCGTGAI